ncbi:MAG: DNA-3-methyladenine glycosylase [Chthoniobacterales bacterium]|nr:DNA-3-methyladenine glycosylase [Chthoniobacterales bacterium]
MELGARGGARDQRDLCRALRDGDVRREIVGGTSGGKVPRAVQVCRSSGAPVIPRKFFTQSPVECARALVGCELVWGACSGIVVECEAYAATGDPACHTFTRPSAREFVARHRAGTAYVYFNYGMHWMFNVLTKGEEEGFVLIRAIEPRRGLRTMQKRRGGKTGRELTGGPARLASALGVTGRHHGTDLCAISSRCFRRGGELEIVADGRIGISRAAELPWRFSARDNPYVSVPPGRKKPSRGG